MWGGGSWVCLWFCLVPSGLVRLWGPLWLRVLVCVICVCLSRVCVMVPYPRGVGQVGRNLLSAAWSLEVWPRVSSLWRQYGLPSRRSQVRRPLFVGRSPSVTLFLVAFRRSFSIGSFHVGLFSLGQILSLLCIPSVALCWSFSVGRFPSVAAIGRFSVGLLSGSYVLSGGGGSPVALSVG